MISTITTVKEVQIIPTVYFLVFLVLIGFLYHLIRNNEYKNTLFASILTGFIFGLIFNNSFDLVKTVVMDLIFIILVIIGGFISVGLKKLINNSNKKNYNFAPQKPLKSYNWWNKQNPIFKTIMVMVICILFLILIIGAFSILNTGESHVSSGDHVQLKLDFPLSSEVKLADVVNDKEGTVLIISNNLTQYTLKGSSESHATVKITTNEMGIINQTVPLDENSDFTYNLNIPQSVSIIKITVEATKPGKDNSAINLTIKRNS